MLMIFRYIIIINNIIKSYFYCAESFLKELQGAWDSLKYSGTISCKDYIYLEKIYTYR